MILDPATASLATGVPTRTIRRWALMGRLVDHGDGMHILIDPDEVAELEELRHANGGKLPKWRTVA